MKRVLHLALSTIGLICASFALAPAQQLCEPPALATATQGRNIFNDEQEIIVGDVIFERLQRNYVVLEDPALTGRLQELAGRLLQTLPSSKLNFRVYLVDAPEVDAVSLPGGRILFSRKILALVKNEDELAGLMAHELGHALAHHGAIDLSFLFQAVLDVDRVGDRNDIFEKYNRMIEAASHRPSVTAQLFRQKGSEEEAADLIGLYAMARAGYDPAAALSFWERYRQGDRGSGNWFVSVIGTETAENVRLTALRKNAALVPSGCRGQRAPNAEDLLAWQQKVAQYRPPPGKSSVPGLLTSRKLAPSLQNEVLRIRFSPDGNYLLAQDDSGVSVLRRRPLTQLFRIDGIDMIAPSFSPDSRLVTFHTSNLRVEIWDVAGQRMASAAEIPVKDGCLRTELSPDGKTLACYDLKADLSLIDVETGKPFYVKPDFRYHDPSWVVLSTLNSRMDRVTEDTDPVGTSWIQMQFSADGKYFVAGNFSERFQTAGIYAAANRWASTLAFDLATRAPLSISNDLKNLVAGNFAFVGSGKVLGAGKDRSKSELYSFPAGELLAKYDLPGGDVFPVTRGDLILLSSTRRVSINLDLDPGRRPQTEAWRCTFDLTAKTANSLPGQVCLDAYDSTVAAAMPNGRIGLYDAKGGEPELFKLPSHDLTNVTAADITPDLQWLAISNPTHGGVWNLTTGEQRLFLPNFEAGYLTENGKFYALFPHGFREPRTIKHFDLESRQVFTGPAMPGRDETIRGSITVRHGWDRGNGSKLEVADLITSASLWTRNFSDNDPLVWTSRRFGTMVLDRFIDDAGAKADIRDDAALKQKISALKDKRGVRLLTVLDSRTGTKLGSALVDTGRGKFRTRAIYATKDWLILSDSTNRVLIYSLKTGGEVAAKFGIESTVSASGALLIVQNTQGTLELFELGSFQKREQYQFPYVVSLMQFTPDGKKLFVLTQDQTAYVIDTAAFVQP